MDIKNLITAGAEAGTNLTPFYSYCATSRTTHRRRHLILVHRALLLFVSISSSYQSCLAVCELINQIPEVVLDRLLTFCMRPCLPKLCESGAALLVVSKAPRRARADFVRCGSYVKLCPSMSGVANKIKSCSPHSTSLFALALFLPSQQLKTTSSKPPLYHTQPQTWVVNSSSEVTSR